MAVLATMWAAAADRTELKISYSRVHHSLGSQRPWGHQDVGLYQPRALRGRRPLNGLSRDSSTVSKQ